MSKENTPMNAVFARLNDLKSVFKLGEKVVPIIQNLTEFMQEMIPLIENINMSISQSTSQMPKATNQINDVTSATELATTEILDLVDEITSVLTGVDDKLKTGIEKHARRKELADKLRDQLGDNKTALKLLDEFTELDDSENLFRDIQSKVAKINEDTYKITLSLQVQDITAQQLSAVNHLIESVNDKLSSLVNDIDESDLRSEFQSLNIDVPDGAHYDPDAKYDTTGERQKNADNIINDQKQKASQEEIDKLFS